MHPSVISYPTCASPLRWYDIIYNQGRHNTEETATRKKEEIYFSNFSTVPPPPDYQKIASSLISINALLETRRGNHSARTFSSPSNDGVGKGRDILWEKWFSRRSFWRTRGREEKIFGPGYPDKALERKWEKERERETFCKLDYVAFFSLFESSRSLSPFSSTVKLISEDERNCGPHSLGSPFLPSLLSSPSSPSSFLLFFSLLPPVTPRPAIYIIWNKSLKFVDDPLTLWLLHVEKKKKRKEEGKGQKRGWKRERKIPLQR